MAKVLPLPYVPIDPSIVDSKRFQDFMDELELDEGDALKHLVAMICFAGRKYIDGNFERLTPRQLARHCYWQGDPQAFHDALCNTGWLLETPTGYRLEGWERHGGKVLDERERNRLKSELRRNKEKVPGYVPGTQPVRSRDVTGTFPAEVEVEVEVEEDLRNKEEEEEERGGERARALTLVSTLPLPEISSPSSARQYDFAGLKMFIQNSGILPLKPSSKYWKAAAELAKVPFTQDELKTALQEAREAKGETNGGMLVYCLIQNRKQAAKPPKMTKRGQQFRKAMTDGHAELMKRFADE